MAPQRYLVAATTVQTHWVRRGWAKTLCGLPRTAWRYLDARKAVECTACNSIKAKADAVSSPS